MSGGAKMKLRIRNDEHCKKPVQLAVSMTGISLDRLLCATFTAPTCTPVQISERHRWVPRKIVRLDHRDKSKDLGVNERRRKNATREDAYSGARGRRETRPRASRVATHVRVRF